MKDARLAAILGWQSRLARDLADMPHSIIESKLQKHRSAISYEVKECPVRPDLLSCGTPFAYT